MILLAFLTFTPVFIYCDMQELSELLRIPKSEQKRSEEHTSELQSRSDLVCRLLLEKKKKNNEPSARTNETPWQLHPARRQDRDHDPRRPHVALEGSYLRVRRHSDNPSEASRIGTT